MWSDGERKGFVKGVLFAGEGSARPEEHARFHYSHSVVKQRGPLQTCGRGEGGCGRGEGGCGRGEGICGRGGRTYGSGKEFYNQFKATRMKESYHLQVAFARGLWAHTQVGKIEEKKLT